MMAHSSRCPRLDEIKIRRGYGTTSQEDNQTQAPLPLSGDRRTTTISCPCSRLRICQPYELLSQLLDDSGIGSGPGPKS